MSVLARIFSDDAIARVIALVIWLVISVMLVPSFVRCIAKRPRYIDPLFGSALVLTLNRVAFGVQAFVQSDLLADCSRWSGIIGALFYLFVISDYLKDDHDR